MPEHYSKEHPGVDVPEEFVVGVKEMKAVRELAAKEEKKKFKDISSKCIIKPRENREESPMDIDSPQNTEAKKRAAQTFSQKRGIVDLLGEDEAPGNDDDDEEMVPREPPRKKRKR